MAHALVRLLPMEMAVLGLFELMLSFGLIFFMLIAGGPATLLESTNPSRDGLVLAGMLAVTIAGIAATIGLYRPEVCLHRRRFTLTCAIVALFAFPAILLVSRAWQLTLSGHHVMWFAWLMVVWLLFMMLFRYGVSAVALRVPVARRVLIVGTGPRAARLRRRLAAERHWLFEPVAPGAVSGAIFPGTPFPVDVSSVPAAEPPTPVSRPVSCRVSRRVWGIVIAGDAPAGESHAALLDKKLRGVPVYSDVSFQEHHLGRIELDGVDDNWLLFCDGFRNGWLSRAVKRASDIAVSLGLMIVTLPLVLITAILIKLDSPGPVLYRQERTGLHGAPFTLFKFRSMSTDAEVAGKPQWAQKSDPRVTRIGAFIRASRIDELPQLINVLCGEMSMIGPRPERPVFVEQLAEVIPLYNHRACVKPGLTGWAQVNFPYGASIEDAREKLAYDLYYVKNRGILLDLVILFSTVRVILFREGAR